MRMSANIEGSGKLTAGEIIQHLQQVPQTAFVKVKSTEDPRDGLNSWSIQAEWDGTVGTFPSHSTHPFKTQFATR